MGTGESLPLNEPAKSETVLEILKNSRVLFDALVEQEPPIIIAGVAIPSTESKLYYSSDNDTKIDDKCNAVFGPIDLWDAEFLSYAKQFKEGNGYFYGSYQIDFSGLWDDQADTALSIAYQTMNIKVDGFTEENGLLKEVTISMDGKCVQREVFDIHVSMSEAKESELMEADAQKVLADLQSLLLRAGLN